MHMAFGTGRFGKELIRDSLITLITFQIPVGIFLRTQVGHLLTPTIARCRRQRAMRENPSTIQSEDMMEAASLRQHLLAPP